MAKVKRAAVQTCLGTLVAGSIPLFFDKVADYYVSTIASDDNITLIKILFFSGLLLAASLILSGIQGGGELFRSIRRRFRNETRLEELQRRIRELRNEIILSSRKFRASKEAFNNQIDAASSNVSRLNQTDRGFLSQRGNAVVKILGLKAIYQNNVSDFEKLAMKACQDIDAADKVFQEAKKWADEDVEAIFNGRS